MRRLSFVMVLCGFLYAQGLPHMIYGVAYNANGTPVQAGCGGFYVYPYPSANDTVQETMTGSGFPDSAWFAEISSLGLTHGDSFAVYIFNRCNGDTALFIGVYDSFVTNQNVGRIDLVPGLPTLTVLSPNGGETYLFGDNVSITWAASLGVTSVRLYYTANGGATWNYITTVPATPELYNWTAPNIQSTQYLIAIRDNANPLITDTSDNFFSVIQPPYLQFVYPVGSETFHWDEDVNIMWVGTGCGTATLEFSSNGGGSWELIASGLPMSGNYHWSVPHIVSNQCQLRVFCNANPAINDYTGLFVIDTLALPPVGDTIPPSSITDLVVDSVEYYRARIRWTNTGDDGFIGNASALDIRYSEFLITPSNWWTATVVPEIPAPLPSGVQQTVWITGLLPGHTYYFAMRVADEVPNWSALSNVPSATLPVLPPGPDTIPPAQFPLVVEATSGAFARIGWNAPGDDGNLGTAMGYEFRYATFPLNAENFGEGDLVPGVPAPQPAGTHQTVSIYDLRCNTRYWVAARAFDEIPNFSDISVVDFWTGECVDTIRPAFIRNTACMTYSATQMQLTFMASGDDGFDGFADHYDVRFATYPLNPGNWVYAPSYLPAIAPGIPGSNETVLVAGLTPGTQYWFVVFAVDEQGNYSPFGTYTSCYTMGVVNPLSDVIVSEGSPDFLLGDLNNVFIPSGLTYSVQGCVGVSLYLVGSQVFVHLEPAFSGQCIAIASATNGISIVSDTVVITVLSQNNPPYFTSPIPDSIAVEGTSYGWTFTGDDPDGDTLRFFLRQCPPGMTLTSGGYLTWVPPSAAEDRYIVIVGLTDGEDTVYQQFPVRVYKRTHPYFAPRNLIAGDGYVGCIPIWWDPPLAVGLGLPVTLVRYEIWRSLSYDAGYTFVKDVPVDFWADPNVVSGTQYYYKVRAVYSSGGSFFSGPFSNIDDGYSAVEGNRIYSPYIWDVPVVDGSPDDESWADASRTELISGTVVYLANNHQKLYGLVDIPGASTGDEIFNLWFDRNLSRWWEVSPVEGRVRFAYGEPAKFGAVIDDAGVPFPIAPAATDYAAGLWSISGTHTYLEFSVDLGSAGLLGRIPGDSLGVSLQLLGGSPFLWPTGSDVLNPATFGILYLGAPGGVPDVVVFPPSLELTVEQGLIARGIFNIQNIGGGVAFINIVSLPNWAYVNTSSAFLGEGISAQFVISVDTDELEIGTYSGQIVIHTNDPVNPVMTVNLVVHVEPTVPGHLLFIYPPGLTNTSFGSSLSLPLSISQLWDAQVFSMNFVLDVRPLGMLNIVGVHPGANMPADWSLTFSAVEPGQILVEAYGHSPIATSGEIVRVDFQVSYTPSYGNISEVVIEEVNFNEGFPYGRGRRGIVIIGDEAVPQWDGKIVLVLPNGARSDSASFGLHPLATDNYDVFLDRINLPVAPGFYDIHFTSADGAQLTRDIRYSELNPITYPLAVSSDGTLVWNPELMWRGFRIGANIDMTQVSSVYVNSGSVVPIVFDPVKMRQFKFHFFRGWNLISLPVVPSTTQINELFPSVLPLGYYYDPTIGNLMTTTTLEPGKGYWVFSMVDVEYTIEGEPVVSVSQNLSAGWNLIGAPAQPMLISDARILPCPSCVIGIYGYEPSTGSYTFPTIFQPGQGYWIFAANPVVIEASIYYISH